MDDSPRMMAMPVYGPNLTPIVLEIPEKIKRKQMRGRNHAREKSQERDSRQEIKSILLRMRDK